MIISIDKQYLFFHVPKTAGTEIRKWLKSNSSNITDLWLWDKQGVDKGHLHRHNISKYINLSDHVHYYKFAFVRNPYHRIYSAYNEVKWKGPCKQNSFEQILTNFISKQLWNKIDVHFRPQSHFIIDANDKLMINDYYKYEELEYSLNLLTKKFNNNPFVNKKTNKHNYHTYFENYSQQMIDIINITYAEDFEKFNYFKIPEIIYKFRFPTTLNDVYIKQYRDIIKDTTLSHSNDFELIKHNIIWMRRKKNPGNVANLKHLLNTKFNELRYFISSKWLISIIESYIDFGSSSEISFSTIIVSTFMFEKLILSNKHSSNFPLDDLPLYSGLWNYNIKHGDMLRNKMTRIVKCLKQDPFFFSVFKILFINSLIYDNGGLNSSIHNSHELHKTLQILLT